LFQVEAHVVIFAFMHEVTISPGVKAKRSLPLPDRKHGLENQSAIITVEMIFAVLA